LGVKWVNFDGDNDLDRFVCNQTGQNLFYRNDGNGVFVKITGLFNTAPGFFGVSWVDFDNDGWLDLFVSVPDGTKNRLHHNNGDGTFRRVLTGPIADDLGVSSGSGWSDYDGDGFLDLFVATSASDPQPNDYLYHNDGNSNAWITVKCVGTRSNRSAVGAKVRVKATIDGKTFWQLREINTGSIWDDNPLEAHFGLGNATNVETLRIEWPSGTMQEFPNVAAKQYLTVTESSRLLINLTNGLPQLTLHGGRNLQYDIQASTNSTDWSLLTTLTITNLNGIALITDTNAPISERRLYRAVLR